MLNPLRYLLFLLICLPPFVKTNGQFYDFGQDPSSLQWKRLDTEHFRIIYPHDFGNNAGNLAHYLESNYAESAAGLNYFPEKVPVIIHNQSVFSNAFVTWAPKRMEFFTFPDPGLFATDWLTELSLHEFRHVVQISSMNRGFTRFLTLLLGEQATGVVAGLMPLWFFEGDAVAAETDLSSAGRGRLPSFEMEWKALLLSDKKQYSFSKAYLGSYRDFVPDYYRLGYQMVSHARRQYGEDYWAGGLKYAASKAYLVSPLNLYARKISGGGHNALYNSTMDHLRNKYSVPGSDTVYETGYLPDQQNMRTYTSYVHPVLMPDSSVIALKSSLTDIPRFISLREGTSGKIIHTPGSMVSGRFSIHNDRIIWDQYVADPRWRNRNYSVIREYDIASGKTRNLSVKSRYLFPSLSPEGDKIVAVNVKPDYRFSLIILDSENGNIREEIPSPGNLFLQYPVWIKNAEAVAVIATGKNGKYILEYNIRQGHWNGLLKAGFQNIDHLGKSSSGLIFNGTFNGSDQIYSLSEQGTDLRLISNAKFGAFYPSASPGINKLVYSAYSTGGYRIAQISSVENKGYKTDSTGLESIAYPFPVSEILPAPDPPGIYPVSKYSKASGLFRFHSYAPWWLDYMDPNLDDPGISPGFTLLSQNDLGTAFTSLGYERRNGNNLFHLGFTYKGFYPVIDVSTVYGDDPAVALIKDVIPPRTHPGLNTVVSSYIPLTLTSGRVITGLQPSLKLSYTSTYYYHFDELTYKRGASLLQPGIYFYSYQRTSLRDIQPRLGFTLEARYTSTPFESGLFGSNSSLRSGLYLPGLLPNHGLRFRWEWQSQNVESYYLPNQINLPRGYAPSTFINMERYSADYVLPIAYPDLTIGPLLYVKRIRATLFLDYMKGTEKYISETETSAPVYPFSQGIEIYTDYHIFRFIFELTSGLRISWLPKEGIFTTNLLFNVNLDKFL